MTHLPLTIHIPYSHPTPTAADRHDLALDNERIEPEEYTQLLANITRRIIAAAPKAKLIWVTVSCHALAETNSAFCQS